MVDSSKIWRGDPTAGTGAGVEVDVIDGDHAVPVVSLSHASSFSQHASWILQWTVGSYCEAETLFQPCVDARVQRECAQRGWGADEVFIGKCTEEGMNGVIAVGRSGKRSLMLALAIAVIFYIGPDEFEDLFAQLQSNKLMAAFDAVMQSAWRIIRVLRRARSGQPEQAQAQRTPPVASLTLDQAQDKDKAKPSADSWDTWEEAAPPRPEKAESKDLGPRGCELDLQVEEFGFKVDVICDGTIPIVWLEKSSAFGRSAAWLLQTVTKTYGRAKKIFDFITDARISREVKALRYNSEDCSIVQLRPQPHVKAVGVSGKRSATFALVVGMLLAGRGVNLKELIQAVRKEEPSLEVPLVRLYKYLRRKAALAEASVGAADAEVKRDRYPSRDRDKHRHSKSRWDAAASQDRADYWTGSAEYGRNGYGEEAAAGAHRKESSGGDYGGRHEDGASEGHGNGWRGRKRTYSEAWNGQESSGGDYGGHHEDGASEGNGKSWRGRRRSYSEAWNGQEGYHAEPDQTWAGQAAWPAESDKAWARQKSDPAKSDQSWGDQAAGAGDSDQSWAGQAAAEAKSDQSWAGQAAGAGESDQSWAGQAAAEARSDQSWGDQAAGAGESDQSWAGQAAAEAKSDQSWGDQAAGAGESDQSWSGQATGAGESDQSWAGQAVAPVESDQSWSGQAAAPAESDKSWAGQTAAESEEASASQAAVPAESDKACADQVAAPAESDEACPAEPDQAWTGQAERPAEPDEASEAQKNAGPAAPAKSLAGAMAMPLSDLNEKIRGVLDSLAPGAGVAVVSMVGSFCPVTHAHVASLLEARKILLGLTRNSQRPVRLEQFQACVGMLSLNTDRHVWHKMQKHQEPFLNWYDRAHLVRVATRHYAWLGLSSDRPMNFLSWLKANWPHLKFVMFWLNGADDVANYRKWTLASCHCRFITMGRPGDTERVLEGMREAKIDPDDGFFILGPELPDISSTKLRALLSRGETDPFAYRDFVDSGVAEWCIEKWASEGWVAAGLS